MFLPNFSRLVIIGSLTLNLKRLEVLLLLVTSYLVQSVVRKIMLSALLGRTIALGVARVATLIEISLMLTANTREVGMLKLVFLM